MKCCFILAIPCHYNIFKVYRNYKQLKTEKLLIILTISLLVIDRRGVYLLFIVNLITFAYYFIGQY